ncbi:hypothetical protein KDA_69820 [Dictyobacter alpinus]|uniref:Uncharacterized protein n=1 Tax=Dictyobacter alpinus TaxID=2014873 RepID=A0A402BJG9_9CHLR|nr:hypothetical protein KDA_69820 [Dictyobacter alpinus]
MQADDANSSCLTLHYKQQQNKNYWLISVSNTHNSFCIAYKKKSIEAKGQADDYRYPASRL